MKQINLKEIFIGLQEQMATKLRVNRVTLHHPGTKGDSFEVNWIEWLRNYLPKRYSVDKAFVIDCESHFSDQIDVVIYDRQYSPFVFNQDGALYIPAESVYAVFEVKPELSKVYIEYAGAKAESVRVLNRTSAPIVHAGGCYNPKPHSKILAGILTLTSTWNPALGQSFDESVNRLNEVQMLDIGCVLESGSFHVNNSKTINIVKSSPEESLISFFLTLLIEIQKLGTTPAMDITCYAKALDFFKES